MLQTDSTPICYIFEEMLWCLAWMRWWSVTSYWLLALGSANQSCLHVVALVADNSLASRDRNENANLIITTNWIWMCPFETCISATMLLMSFWDVRRRKWWRSAISVLFFCIRLWYKSLSQMWQFVSGFQLCQRASPVGGLGLAMSFAWAGSVVGNPGGYVAVSVALWRGHVGLLCQFSALRIDDVSACSASLSFAVSISFNSYHWLADGSVFDSVTLETWVRSNFIWNCSWTFVDKSIAISNTIYTAYINDKFVIFFLSYVHS